MPTGRRIRSACQVCHARGRYQRLVVTLSWQGVTYWRQLTFCAVDRAIWLDMTFGKKGLQSRYAVATATRSDQPAAAARDELEQPRRVKHIRRRRDLWAEPG